MSYEGYDQYLCGNGHYWIQDCNNDNEECPVCKGKFVWRNGVNETNFDGWGYIDMEKFLVTPAVNVTCPTCHHESENTPPIYRVPTQDEANDAKTCRDENGNIISCSEELKRLEAENDQVH